MTPDDQREYAFCADGGGERLDVYLARASGLSRARVQGIIDNGGACVNDRPAKANYRLKAGDDVRMTEDAPSVLSAAPEALALDIVYQDSDIAVINKAQGMAVHPAPGSESGTLVNALLHALDDLSGIGGALRPGIVHRIDKMTSGLLVVAKNDAAHASLSAQIKAHTAQRAYLAIVEGGFLAEAGTVRTKIGRHPTDRKRMAVVENGREAATHWRVLARAGEYSFVEAVLETGRTHQIRVHMRHIRHPVAGDPVYGYVKRGLGLAGQALHAYRLELAHPATGEAMRFYAQPPAYFLEALARAGLTAELGGENAQKKIWTPPEN